MMGCDTLLMVGSNFPYAECLPEEGQARGVQIDIDGKMLGIRYPMEVHLEGDSAETLRALAPLLRRKEDRSWRERLEASIRDWWHVVEERAMSSADPINPSASSGSCRRACPTTASSAPIRAASPTGSRAT